MCQSEQGGGSPAAAGVHGGDGGQGDCRREGDRQGGQHRCRFSGLHSKDGNTELIISIIVICSFMKLDLGLYVIFTTSVASEPELVETIYVTLEQTPSQTKSI